MTSTRQLGGLLFASCLLASACGSEGEAPPPRRVILISIDTLRADHLSAYGYERPSSPNLDRFAQDAVLFENAYSQSSWTLPSHMSMFTGLYPLVHGVNDPSHKLASEVWTLPEILKAEGFATTAFTDGGFMAGEHGFDSGFDEYRQDNGDPLSPNCGLTKSYPRMEAWTREHVEGDFFMFVHTFDVHGPYRVEGEHFGRFLGEAVATEKGIADFEFLKTLEDSDYLLLDRFGSIEELIAAYDGGILFTDHMLGRFFDLLDELGLYEDSLIIVTSDHGESFFDENVYLGHGIFLHDAETKVPLMIKFPGNRFAGTRFQGMVESVDLLPTILQTCRISPPQTMMIQGTSLLDLVLGGVDPNPVAYSTNPFFVENYAMRTDEWTVLSKMPDQKADMMIATRLRPEDEETLRERLFNEHRLISNGESPLTNRRDQSPELFNQLAAKLTRWRKVQSGLKDLIAHPERRESFRPGEIDQLQKLGYLGGTREKR
ncbi:MAG: sulfatase [Planctomycetota bacterium]